MWTVKGGMHELALALASLAQRKGACIRHGQQVTEIVTHGARVSAVRTAEGEIPCDAVIVNADASAVGSGLFGREAARAVKPVAVKDRSLAAITWATMAETIGFPLARHNVLFSRDYAQEFRELSTGYPSDPTVYICAQDREGHEAGRERMLILVNAPANGDHAPQDSQAVEQAMRRKLQQCGLAVDWAKAQSVITDPKRFGELFPATGGALYGRASHGWMASFQRPGARTAISGLFLTGGSVHPGPGVPMAALSGQLAAESLMASRASTRRFRPAATVGGMSTA